MPSDTTSSRILRARSLKAIFLKCSVFVASIGIQSTFPLIHERSMRIISPERMPVRQARTKAAQTRCVFVRGIMPSSHPAAIFRRSISSSLAMRSRASDSAGFLTPRHGLSLMSFCSTAQEKKPEIISSCRRIVASVTIFPVARDGTVRRLSIHPRMSSDVTA